ncbi:MAG: RHS repeat-associated core domain-containing protein [Candidatus Angelobacter sp.]
MLLLALESVSSIQTTAVTYDALNRLMSAQNAGTDCSAKVLQNKTEYWGNSYGYDAWGNLLQKSVTKCGAESLSVTADGHNWIHASGTDYQYDAAGNMTFNATPPTQTYTYDQENRLTGAAGYTYTYDGDGNRVRKSSGSTGTLYWYMTPGIVAESDLSGNLQSEYVFFDGERVARKDFPSNAISYYFSDHLKTASVVTDSLGNIKSESDFYRWGGELQFSNNDSNHYKFGGHEHDAETGLEYYGARNYSSRLGRFVTSDWSATPVPVPYADFDDPQSLNLYGYVLNNPLSKIDPNGHEDLKPRDWVDPKPQPTNAQKDAVLPKPDAQHDHTITVREVEGQNHNVAGHVTVQVDGGKEMGFAPKDASKSVLDNKSVPGQVEPRADGVKTLDAVTINVTADQANHAQGTIDATTTKPGNYQLVGNSCVNFAENVMSSAGAPTQNVKTPGGLIEVVRKQQYQDNTTQTH